MSDKMIKMARLFKMFVALLAVEAAAATSAITVRNGVPNAALFARRNAAGNQYFFCLGDSTSTPWVEFARIVAKDLGVRTIPHVYPEPAGAGFARYSCVNGQAIYGERVCSGYLAVLDYSATGARGDVKREAAYLENLVRAIYNYRATHSVIILHTTPSPYVAEAEKIADHYGIPTLDLTDAKDAAERSARLTAFAAALFKDAVVPAKPVPRKLPPPLHPGAELRPQIVSYEHPEVRFDDGWLGWQRPNVQQVRHVIDAKRKGAKVTLTFTGGEVGVFDEATPQSSAFAATVDGGAPRVVAPPAGGKVFLRHTPLFEGLDPAREHVLTLEVRDDAPLRLAGFSLSGSVKTPKETRSPLERMRQKLEALPPMVYEPPAGRFEHIPETMRRLREGGTLTIVMLGDSIVNDTSSSRFEELLMKRYPKCRIRKVVSVRGSTGCDWYAQENRVREWALKYKPDLMMIGGISHRPDPSKMRDVVRQIRAEKPDTEFLLLTPVFGSEANVWNLNWTPEIDHATPNPRAIIERIAAEEKCAFFDMTGPLGVFIRDSKMARGAFMRDAVHANERGFAVLGELLNRWFAPEN